MPINPVVSHEAWLAARTALLAKEKELSRQVDEVSAARRALPWVKVDKPYLFEGPGGRESLSDLFAGRSQLLVDHFMMAPGWREGCPICSFAADHLDGMIPHLAARDVTLVVVSRAPWTDIQPFKARMGWRFKWVSSHGSDFNYDYNVSFPANDVAAGKAAYNYRTAPGGIEELPGISVFHKASTGDVYHTYSTYGRGCEAILGTYRLLDLTPKGRDETGRGNLTDWVKHHDRY